MSRVPRNSQVARLSAELREARALAESLRERVAELEAQLAQLGGDVERHEAHAAQSGRRARRAEALLRGANERLKEIQHVVEFGPRDLWA